MTLSSVADHAALADVATLALSVTWDPTIRGILVVLVSFLVLIGGPTWCWPPTSGPDWGS